MPDSPSPSTPRQTWQPPSAEELQVLLPQYEISEMLGRGGMGAVYKGRQIALDRPVAIKILSNLLDEADASFAERFKNEARAMGRIMHPGVVAVFDFGETSDGLLYIVMEFVEGTDVSRMLARQGRLPPDHALAITAHVLDALAYAHARGIIHRDIKPANVMVGYDGVVKVADFGLAKMSHDGHSGLTQSGTAMGTLHYMAPESLMLGTSVDHRADIYAVGVMLYQMLTGRLPQGMFELPSSQVPGLDPRYDGIIAKALRDDRELRYQSAMEMRQALDAILTEPVARVEAEATRAPAALPTQARPQPGPKQQPYRPPPPAKSAAPAPASSTRRALVWVALLVLAVFGGLAWLVFAPPWAQGDARQPAGGPTAAQGVNPSAQSRAVTKDNPFTNSLGMKFVPVPGTEVLFCIHEVRYKDYAAYALETSGVDGSWKDQTADGYTPTERPAEHPVTRVTWEDAQNFCAWLSKKEGKLYRLPTDQEWSLAVGIGHREQWSAGTTPSTVFKDPKEFLWGTQWPPPRGCGNYSDESRKAKAPKSNAGYLSGYDDGYPTTAPVMSFPPNKLGLYDLGGNVWEWVQDWFDDQQKDRVIRGGAWYFYGRSSLLSSNRYHFPPDTRLDDSGFRLVLASAENSPDSASADPKSSILPPTAPSPRAATVTNENPFVNTLGMKFVPVPGTEVLFCIHETRYKDYAAYASATSGVDGAWKDQSADGFTPTERNEDHPVVKVSWEDAQKFCAWLSKKEGKTYRLPTDKEWSLAVGLSDEVKRFGVSTPAMLSGKDATHFPWGGSFPPKTKGQAGNQSDESRRAKAPNPTSSYVDGYEDGFPTTAPVMSFKPNALGLFDLEGNVREWVEDWWDEARTDRVLRGGCFNGFSRSHMLSSERAHYPPDYRIGGYGFRVVLVSGTAAGSAPAAPPAAKSSPSAAPSALLKNASKEAPFVNTLGMKFVPVPGTEVLFCIHETRHKDYAAYAAEVSTVDGAWKDQSADGIPCGDKDDHPVVGVSWEDAAKFCEWLSKREGKTYRLPTDEEWSITAGLAMKENRFKGSSPETLHGRENTEFPWGDDYPPTTNDRAGNYADSAFLEKFSTDPGMKDYTDGFPTTAPVMSFKPNKIGLYDMGGNVWEWVEDWWNTTKTDRVLRGGAFGDYAQAHLLSSHRLHRTPGFRNNGYGFRVVIEPATTTTGRIPVQSPPLGAAAKWAVQPWTDGLAAWWNGTKNNECFSLHPDGTTRQNCDFGILTAIHENSPVVRDQAARVKARFDGDWGDGSDLFRVYVRRTKNAAGVFSNYTAGLNRSGHIRLGFYQGSVYTGLRNFTLPANFNFGLHHTLELRAVGDELTVFLDGTELGRLKHSGIREGHPALFAKKGAIIASFEYKALFP